MPARTQVFDYGDLGDCLYVVLDGVVDVIIPTEKSLLDERPAISTYNASDIKLAMMAESFKR